jgi:thiol-disulfide isomerase/thioredoxin
MKIFFILLLFIGTANCGSSQQPEKNTANTPSEPVEEQEDVLLGNIDKNDLQQPPHAAWFDAMYQSYKPEEAALQIIKENINDYEIKMFMGTWCADSQLEVPKFYKLLDLSNFDFENLEVIAVSEDKMMPDNVMQEFDVVYVPTIIFYKNGTEAGRFVEYAQEELEMDIAKIVSGQEYKHPYQ